uniref:Uncharacterized protein n=1 Tax=uncultured bacterium contig00107 TaxID=1181573 RepID=A0A806K2E5_9BACT|nr:hypothetical protein [uncultured bacterium contig00107]
MCGTGNTEGERWGERMSWDDIDEIIFDGTPEQIADVKCPECGIRKSEV